MRTVRRVSRTVLFGGMLLMVILFLMGEFIKVDGLAFAALACGFASAISYFVLFFVGGVIHPRHLQSQTKAARRRLRD